MIKPAALCSFVNAWAIVGRVPVRCVVGSATQAASNAATQQLSSITLVPPRQTMEEGHRWCPIKWDRVEG